MKHLEKILLDYLTDPINWKSIERICTYDYPDCHAVGADIPLKKKIAETLARHILKSRPRKKSKKSRIRAPISFGPADMPEIN